MVKEKIMKNKKQLKFVSIQSKVSPETAERIDRIVEQNGFESRYELMQYLLSAFLKYADNEMEGSDEISEFAKIFEGYQNRKNRIITTKPGGNRSMKLIESINIFSEIGRRGYVCKRIVLNGDRESITSNNESAIRSVLRKLFPDIARCIESIGNDIGECNYIRILEYIMEKKDLDDIKKNIEDEFKTMKQEVKYGETPVRLKHKTVNEL